MDSAIVVAIIAAVEAIGVAVITGLVSRQKADAEAYRKKREAQEAEAKAAQAERERRREQRNTAMLSLLFADAEGTEVLLHKAHGDDVNGNVDEALGSIRRAKADLNHIVNMEAMKL